MKLQEDLWKYVQGSTESLIISEILMGILILQYTFRMEPISIFEIITSVVSGLYVADLGTGITHLIADMYNNYSGDNKIILSLLFDIRHHEMPNIVLDRDIITELQNTSATPLPLLCILYNLTPLTSKSQILFQIISLYATHFSTNIHKCSHTSNYMSEEEKQTSIHKIIKFLQDNHLILHPKEHRIHHTSPKYDVNFCVVNGWANPLLNSIVHIPFIHSKLFPDDVP